MDQGYILSIPEEVKRRYNQVVIEDGMVENTCIYAVESVQRQIFDAMQVCCTCIIPCIHKVDCTWRLLVQRSYVTKYCIIIDQDWELEPDNSHCSRKVNRCLRYNVNMIGNQKVRWVHMRNKVDYQVFLGR